jgi:transposase
LEPLLGEGTPAARVAFEACREGWYVHDKLERWGKEPVMLDTTRVRRIGVGEHGRKNDAIDADAIGLALDSGRVPVAHVLSPARRILRAKLSVRGELVDMRARQVVIIRGLARAAGVLLPTSSTGNFLEKVEGSSLDDATRALIAPLVATLQVAEKQIGLVDAELAQMAEKDPVIRQCATAPGVGVIVAATFVSVIDEAKRFPNANAVGAYLGLVPNEHTTGGPENRKLGSITKRGNTHARKMLVQSAWQILRAGDKDDPLRRWALGVANKRGTTKGKKIAAVALARKLAGVLWAMWRDGTVYDPAFGARESTKGLRAAAQGADLRAVAMARAAKRFSAANARARRAPRRRPRRPSRAKRRRGETRCNPQGHRNNPSRCAPSAIAKSTPFGSDDHVRPGDARQRHPRAAASMSYRKLRLAPLFVTHTASRISLSPFGPSDEREESIER